MRIGTIGTSWITESFMEAVRQTDTFQLTAVYSRAEEKAKSFAALHNVPGYFTNIQEMAESGAIDCVYIASPNALHFEQAVYFLENKKHVICEKPMFSNVKEMDLAYKKAKDNNVYLFEALKNIHTPNFVKLKEALPKIGKVRTMMLHRIKYSSRYDEVLKGKEPNIFSLDYSGGCLVDLGVYPIAIAVALFGKPEKVTYTPVLLPTGADGAGTLVLAYTDFVCTIICSKITTAHGYSEIQGEAGTLSINNIGTLQTVEVVNRAGDRVEVGQVGKADNSMKYEIERFAAIMREKDQQAYRELKEISREVLRITETARRQNDMLFGCER
ncbi:Gfo/Idh/MocA family protein [Virgibacillus halodenitrificans]|uniref:Gfo/Idh/MocA family protein n=1 Tax=Virgibacillus halodenitrificans TaxID=1482 RepID=UPI002DBE4E06|nr:Gfo/Idh/MocA family oxidoreductase [Virgibacillus halodenitrificans]MEC2159588.1 Gfo/Idh/MocA family oxidoreductase [Virgibacillus halodenitrificans]